MSNIGGNVERFSDAVLKSGVVRERRQAALDVLSAALDAVDPAAAVRRFLTLDGEELRIGESVFHLGDWDRIFVAGAGKASASMAAAVEGVLGNRVVAGLVIVKYGHTVPTERVKIVEAGHPVPDERGIEGTREMAELLRAAGPRDLVIALMSGGGSALMELPVEGISLDDVKSLTGSLLRCGATINQMNTIRKHLSQVKGGGLARLASPASVVSLILSDVVGNPLDVIASGPTVPDTTTFEDAWRVIEEYGLSDRVPAPVFERLQSGRRGQVAETPKQGDPAFSRVTNVIVASNELAAEAAEGRARALGFETLLLSTYVEGEAREAGKFFAAIARELSARDRPLRRPACVIAGGETTVTIHGEGKGGRNQELALSAALKIAGVEGAMVVASATDGNDGPTDATGAIVDGSTVIRALQAGLDPSDYLARNDSYRFFEQLGDLIITGPTNTNVNDLTFVYQF